MPANQQRSRSAAHSDHGQMATVLEAVNFEDHRVAGVAFKCGLRFRAW
jgi:hypothetical protein